MIDGAVGDHDIARMWKLHFEQLYSSVDCSNDKKLFLTRMGSSLPDASPAISLVVTASATNNQKKARQRGLTA